MAKNRRFKAAFLSMAALVALGTLTLTGCTTKLEEAQNNIDNSVVAVLNADESIQNQYNAAFSDFTFLCADVEGLFIRECQNLTLGVEYGKTYAAIAFHGDFFTIKGVGVVLSFCAVDKGVV